MPFVAALLAGLSALIKTKLGMWVAAGMLFLGIEFATYEVAIGPALEMVRQQAAGAGAASGVAAWLGFLNVDRYLSIVLSAFLVGQGKRVLLRGTQ